MNLMRMAVPAPPLDDRNRITWMWIAGSRLDAVWEMDSQDASFRDDVPSFGRNSVDDHGPAVHAKRRP